MSITASNPSAALFAGIYDAPEAARYLKAAARESKPYPADSAKLIQWIRRGFASPELIGVPGRELLLDFTDLVSMRMIAALRASGVSWPEITKTKRWFDEMDIDRPFATESLWTGQGEIYADWSRLLSASRSGQTALDALRDYLIPVHGLAFSDETELATSWEPMPGVSLDPDFQFGAPCVKGTRIPTRTIFGMMEAGDSADWIAEAYSISLDEVLTAYDWESRVQSR